jgi:hypothetical protein
MERMLIMNIYRHGNLATTINHNPNTKKRDHFKNLFPFIIFQTIIRVEKTP